MYLLWRVMSGLNVYIEYSFMTVGHTKFSCDRCFGNFKQKVNLTPMHTLYDVGKVCEQSAACNASQLVGSHDGTVFVPCYNWQEYLSTFFRKVDNITDYHHFVFSQDAPGFVNCSVKLKDAPTKIKIQKKNARSIVQGQLPEVVSPTGFSPERELYLYNDIREFCKEGTEDLVAPEPKSNSKSKRPRKWRLNLDLKKRLFLKPQIF